MKIKFLKYEKSEKQAIEISFRVKKWQNHFIQEIHVCAGRRNFFSSCNQMMCKGELFKMVRVTFETEVSEVRKKVKS